jgi:DNA-binding response OmpR family regulator
VAARIRSVLRRRDSRREGPRRIGDLFIDPGRREVRVGDRDVKLANKEFSLLRALAEDPHRVFRKDELLADVCGFRSIGRERIEGMALCHALIHGVTRCGSLRPA